MPYQLPPDIDQRVQSQIALGIYSTPAEVLNEALDALERRNADIEAIREGINAWHRGEVQDLDKFDSEFRARNGIS
jgi:Arc/MetJ-type ribon-helix-helix transcriptional regulator